MADLISVCRVSGRSGCDAVSSGERRGWRVGPAASGGQAVEVAVELLVSDRPFVVGGKTDRQGPAEPEGDEGDVVRRLFVIDRPVIDGCSDELVEDVACGLALFGPVVVVEERMHDVDGAESGVDGGMQIATQRVASVRLLRKGGTTVADRTVQDLDRDGPQQPLPIREVSVQRGDTDPGAFGDGVSGRFAADLDDDLDRCVDDQLSVPSSVSAHCTAPLSAFRGDPWKRSIILHL